jgi:hypothetical protein
MEDAAKLNWKIAKDEIRRDRLCIHAYMNADKPDFKAAIQTLTLAKEMLKC